MDLLLPLLLTLTNGVTIVDKLQIKTAPSYLAAHNANGLGPMMDLLEVLMQNVAVNQVLPLLLLTLTIGVTIVDKLQIKTAPSYLAAQNANGLGPVMDLLVVLMQNVAANHHQYH